MKNLLKFIGNGSAFNHELGNSSAVFYSEKSIYILDCGEDVFAKLKKMKTLESGRNIYIIITHMHSDHVGSLPSLIFYCYYILNIKPNVVFPVEDSQSIAEYLRLSGMNGFEYEYISCFTHKKTQVGEYFIQPVKTNHYNNLPCYGYLIKSVEKTGFYVYYSGDSNSIPDTTLKRFFKYDDMILYQDTCIHENDGHMHIENLGNIITNPIDRKRVHIYHIDSKKLIKKAIKLGFSITKKENNITLPKK